MLVIFSAVLGAIVGLILALTGAGGAMLAIPMLVLFLHLTIHQAAPIALLAVLMASSIGAIQGLRKGYVRYKAAILIAIVGMILAPLGVKLAQQTSNEILSLILIIILLSISLNSWNFTKKDLNKVDNINKAEPKCLINPATSRLFWTASCTKRLIGTGALSGFLSGLLGVGGGFVITPSLYKVSNFSNQATIATTLAAVSLISASSIASHLQSRPINWELATPFIAFATFSMFISSEIISKKIPKAISQKGFALLCLIAAIHLSIENFT
jgi:uncharacterized protein